MNAAIFADIGGTHIRLARAGHAGPEDFQKFRTADFSDLPAALAAYTHGEKGPLYIATAAWPDTDGIYRFARDGRWPVDPFTLAANDWDVRLICNDFGASARGAEVLPEALAHVVRAGGDHPLSPVRYAVLGAGTGLGLAYVDDDGRVLETYGGHMEAPRRTDEQQSIITLVSRLSGHDRPVIAEDIVSGPGLSLLYKASCLMHGLRMEDESPEAIIAHKDEFLYSHTLRLFHEFFGLFAHQAVIFGHAYKALYLDGGIVHSLLENEAFDAARFLLNFTGDPIPLIKKQMAAMPVYIITDPFVALRGLYEMAGVDGYS